MAKKGGLQRNAWSRPEGEDILARLADNQISTDQALAEAQRAFGVKLTRGSIAQAVSRYRRHGGRPATMRDVAGSTLNTRVLEFLEEISEIAVKEQMATYEHKIAELERARQNCEHENEMLRAQAEGRSRDFEGLRARLTQRLEHAGLVGPGRPD